MSQITIYLEDSLATRLRLAAQRDGISVSGWIARIVADRTAQTWPPDILAMAGSWANEPISRPAQGLEVPRESL